MLKHFSLPLLASILVIISASYLILFHYPQLTTNPTTHNPQPNTRCYYQQVQCIRAPCNPILVCISPSPILPNPSPTNTPVNSTLGWKITSTNGTKKYVNLKHGFEFTAPIKYEFSSGPGYDPSVDNFGLSYDNPETIHETAPLSDFVSLGFSIHPIQNTTFKELVTAAYEAHRQVQKDYGTDTGPLKSIKLGDKSGYEYSGSFLIPNLTKFVEINDKYYFQIFLTLNDLKNSGYQREIDKIFNSFKFSSQPSPTCVPRPKCLDANPRCLIPETENMCPPTTNNPPLTTYSCPPSGWLDCMPGPGPAKLQCQKDYLDWIKVSCPDFQGVAY